MSAQGDRCSWGLRPVLALLLLATVGLLLASCAAGKTSPARSPSPSLPPNATISTYLLDLESQQSAFVTDAWMLQKTVFYGPIGPWTAADAATAATETAKIEAMRSNWRKRWPTVPVGCVQLDRDWRKTMDDTVQAGVYLAQKKPSSWRTLGGEQFEVSGGDFHQVVMEEPHVMLRVPEVARGVARLGRALHEMAEACTADPSGKGFLTAVSAAKKDYRAAVGLLKNGPCPLDLATPAKTPLGCLIAMSKAAKAHDVAALHRETSKAIWSLLKAQDLYRDTWAS